MSWLDNLRPASFRGIGFYVDTSNLSTGRRAVLHEYPNRDTPYTEDMGRISDGFEIEGHVIGDNYFEAKKKLQDVFTRKGPGELIHPYYGTKLVQIGPVTISESIREGAIATFTAKFFEAGDNRFPKGENDKGAILSESVESALEQTKQNFDENFSISGLPGFAVESARDLVALAQETFDDITKTFGDVSDNVAALAYSTRNLVAETNDLLQAPSNLSQRLLDSFALLEDAFSSNDAKTNAYSTFYNFGSDQSDPGADTPIREQEQKNQNEFIGFMRRVAAIKSASTASVTDFSSFNDALDARDDIVNVIEEQIRINGDTTFYQSLIDVKAALIEAVPDVSADLPNVKTITTKNTISSILVAYDNFENLNNEQDIIKRNKIRKPAFIEKDTELEVIDGQ